MTYDPNQAGPPATIEIKTTYFFLAFLLALFKPQASIDGGPAFTVGWGSTPVPVPPGSHRVDVWMPYLFLPTMGRNGAVVEVRPGDAVQVAWRAPLVVFFPGKVTVGPAQGGAPVGAGPGGYAPAGYAPAAASPPVQPAAAAPGGWHPDPSGRHQQRYFDGSSWTEHVVDDGVQSTDPTGG